MNRLRLTRARLSTLLTLAGLAFLCAAAWLVALPFGLAAIGAALVLLEWLTGQEPQAAESSKPL